MIGIILIRNTLVKDSPTFKLGGALAGGIVAGSGALLSGIIGNSSGVYQMHSQAEENQKNRDWQTAEAEKARQYNTSERLATQDFQQGLINQMNEYNSPQHQAAMFRQAGLNPNIVLGGQGAIVSANPSQGSPQSSPMPSGVSGLSPVSMQPSDLQIPQMLNGVASLTNALSKSKQTEGSLQLMNEQIKNYVAQTAGQETANQLAKLHLGIETEVKDTTVKKRLLDYCTAEVLNKLYSKDIDVKSSEIDVNKAKEALDKVLAGKTEQEKLQAAIYVERTNDIINASIENQKAQAASAYASAENSRASAEQTKIFNKIYGDERYKHSLISQAVEAGRKAVSESKLTKKQAEQMTYLVEQAAYANDMKEFTYWTGQINQFVNTVGSAASQFYGAGALRELINIRQQQGKPSLLSGNDYYMDGGLLFKK